MKFLTWFRSITHYLFLFGIALIIIGLLYSKLFISIGSFTILGTWIIDWEMKSKFSSFFKNKVAIGISLLFILHLLGLIHTENMDYAIKDIRIKLPLLLFPLIFATSKKLTSKEYLFFKLLLISVVLSTTLISTYFFLFGGDYYSSNSRNISLFISHIRLALLVCLSIFICLDVYFENRDKALLRFLTLGCAIWFIVFLIMAQFITGLVVLIISAIVITYIRVIQSKNPQLLVVSVILTIVIAMLIGLYIQSLHHEFKKTQDVKDLPFMESSVNGEVYLHPDMYNPHPHRQNGFMVYKNIAWKEFEKSWNERSEIDYNGNTIHGYPIKDVALWYLTSKGMRKDSEAIYSLNDEEIKAIENGVSNYNYLHRPGIEVRIIETFWELRNYMDGGDFNGHSIAMRLEFWKTAYHIFKRHWLIGTGTGDINDAFKKQYAMDATILQPEWQLRTHNQYITLATTFGILGFLIALYSFLIPFCYVKRNWVYIAFGLILLTSMLNEDTLETQVGATLFAFFNSFFFFLSPKKVLPIKDSE